MAFPLSIQAQGKWKTDYKGEPWTWNVSSPVDFSRGLQGRHIAIWASHGRYYSADEDRWKWQRPELFGITEDTFTPTIVYSYLVPMLENAGAVVFSPRERDMQVNEVIVDNDDPVVRASYIEVDGSKDWTAAPYPGFGQYLFNGNSHRKIQTIQDGQNPFEFGSARQVKATKKKRNYSLISYRPTFPESGEYAVYVSYQSLPNSADDVPYTIVHQGIETTVHVNQRMGGGTWVYVGTYRFDKGASEANRVYLTNLSKDKRGVVTSDAIRFGGGVGNIARGGKTSGMPRSLEGARYYAQWAGMPYTVYGGNNGSNDYADDINTRANMTNLLAGGSCYVPDREGLGVPIELVLALHTDAGKTKDNNSVIGSLGICTTNFNNGRLASGMSRLASKELAQQLVDNLATDLQKIYGNWKNRGLWDKNYAETRVPVVPSAIVEMLAHQNFTDMRLAHDPHFKFAVARSLYKTIARYVASMHGRDCVIQPLAPDNFSVEVRQNGKAMLRWQPTKDNDEPTATPTYYILYTAVDDGGFDNGVIVKQPRAEIPMVSGRMYRFKVAAGNKGGRSLESVELAAVYHENAKKNILVVNGFNRLASPMPVGSTFDLTEDFGVGRGNTMGWVSASADSLSWHTGMPVAGNTEDYVAEHVNAMKDLKQYNISSCSSHCVDARELRPDNYRVIDWIAGLEKADGYSLRQTRVLTNQAKAFLTDYTKDGGRLLMSGAYIASDQQSDNTFLANVLHCNYDNLLSTTAKADTITGLSTTMTFYNKVNPMHYHVSNPDAIQALGSDAFAAMVLNNGKVCAVAYNGKDCKTFVSTIPLECIAPEKQHNIMHGIISFLDQ